MSTTQYATFVTKTSLSIIDVDTPPPGVSLSAAARREPVGSRPA